MTDNIHNMTPQQIEALHNRMNELYPKLVSASRVNNRQALFEKDLPEGASWSPRRTAQTSSSTVTTNGLMTTTQTPYQPEFADPSRQNYPCVVKGTQVLMADYTYKNVEDIRVGDRVIDKDGHIQVVESVWCEGIPDRLVEINLYGSKKLYTTEQHQFPVWAWQRKCLCGCGQDVVPGKCFVTKHILTNEITRKTKLVYIDGEEDKVRMIRGKPHLCKGKFTRYIPDGYEPMQKLRADLLREGDLLMMPRKFDQINTDVSIDMAQLLGYYVAEGCANTGGHNNHICGFVLNFGEHERETHVKHSSEICERLGIEYKLYQPSTRATDLRVRTNGRKAQETFKWLEIHGGRYAEHKKLSEDVMRWPISLKHEVIRCMFRGDGTQFNNNSHSPNGKKHIQYMVHYKTISKTLANQIQIILGQLGVASAVYTDTSGVGSAKTSYIVHISGAYARDFGKLIFGSAVKETKEYKSPRGMFKHDDNYIYYQIKKINIIENVAKLPVYNIQVSGDHSYVIDNIGTYNCHRILANRYWRMFYKLDPVIGMCIDMMADLPWSSFEFTGDGVEGDILDSYQYMCSESQLLSILPYFIKEFLVVGECVPHVMFDNSKGVFTHIALHNPDQLEVIDSSFIKMDPILEFIPDDRLRAVVTSNSPALRKIRERMPPELLSRLQSRQNIPLSSINATFIPRKLHHYDTRGTSIISRMWRTLMIEDAIANCSIQTARRAAAPIKVAKLGNAATGWIPPPDQERHMLELLVQAEMDMQAWIVTHYGVQFELVGAPERAMSLTKEWEPVERMKLVAMGISKALLSGDANYSTAATGLQVFLQRLKAMRQMFEDIWLYPKFFKPIAEINGWIKPKPSEVAHRFRVRRSAAELSDADYIIPKIVWAKSLDPQVNAQLIQAMQALEGLGCKFSKSSKMAAVGHNYEDETKRMHREIEWEKKFLPSQPGQQKKPGGGGMVGGGGPPPSGPEAPEDSGPAAPGTGGEQPPGVNTNPAPVSPPGAAGGHDDKDDLLGSNTVQDRDTDRSVGKSDYPILKSNIWINNRYGNWDADEVADLKITIEGDEPSSAIWAILSESTAFKDAVSSGDMDNIWEQISNYLDEQGYPVRDIKQLREILGHEGIMPNVPSDNTILDNMTDEEFVDRMAEIIRADRTVHMKDTTLSGVHISNNKNLSSDISDLMPGKRK